MVGIFGNNQQVPQSTSSLNLSQTGAPFGQPTQQFGFGQQPAAQGFMAGLGVQDQYAQFNQFAQQPVAPPSETEILMAMLETLNPVEKFIVSAQMPVMVEMLSNITTFSLLNVLKNSTFKLDEDTGTLSLDVTSLPSDLQTLSAENIVAQLSNLQNQSTSIIQQAEMRRQQVLAMSQQSMLQGALGAALENPGMMENVGNAVGTTARSLLFGGRA
tara:strand:+ start:3341 stop:3985 length:645 start_codon:yes stop_codon:yes gene_type:complete